MLLNPVEDSLCCWGSSWIPSCCCAPYVLLGSLCWAVENSALLFLPWTPYAELPVLEDSLPCSAVPGFL